MKSFIIFLIVIALATAGLQAKTVPVNNQTSFSQIAHSAHDQPEIELSCGQQYYRENSSHILDLSKGARLNLTNLDADVKIITWDKDYARVEILKTSTRSLDDLKDKEVVIHDNGDFTLSTCSSSPLNSTVIQLLIKLPAGVILGDVSNQNGRLCLKKFQPENTFSLTR